MNADTIPPNDSRNPSAPTVPSPRWSLSQSQAAIESQYARGSINIDRPNLGLTDFGVIDLKDHVQLLAESILGLQCDSPLPAADAYVRQPDLTIHFGPAGERQFSHTLLWHLAASMEADRSFRMMHHLSVQTEVLNVSSRLTWVSRLPTGTHATRVLIDGTAESLDRPWDGSEEQPRSAIVVTYADSDKCLALSSPSSDIESAVWQIADASTQPPELILSLRLPPMEKGVIRRYQSAILVTECETRDMLPLTTILEWLEDLETAPPPLTT